MSHSLTKITIAMDKKKIIKPLESPASDKHPDVNEPVSPDKLGPAPEGDEIIEEEEEEEEIQPDEEPAPGEGP